MEKGTRELGRTVYVYRETSLGWNIGCSVFTVVFGWLMLGPLLGGGWGARIFGTIGLFMALAMVWETLKQWFDSTRCYERGIVQRRFPRGRVLHYRDVRWIRESTFQYGGWTRSLTIGLTDEHGSRDIFVAHPESDASAGRKWEVIRKTIEAELVQQGEARLAAGEDLRWGDAAALCADGVRVGQRLVRYDAPLEISVTEARTSSENRMGGSLKQTIVVNEQGELLCTVQGEADNAFPWLILLQAKLLAARG